MEQKELNMADARRKLEDLTEEDVIALYDERLEEEGFPFEEMT